MAYGTVNADVIGTSVSGSNLGAGNASIMKNRIINGAMVIDQRNNGSAVTPNGQYTLDRWYAGNTQTGKYAVQQGNSSGPVGFVNYFIATSSSAYSVGSGDTFWIQQAIEGYNIADLGWGTANAKTVTLSFQVQSSLTGTFGGCITNNATNRSYPFSYTISLANTWTSISVTIAGDTSGTWLTNNSVGMLVRFGLGSGSTYSGTSGSWQAGNYVQPTGTVSVVGTNGAFLLFTGVQLEVGSSATGFEYRQYQQELALCQRYYLKINSANAGGSFMKYANAWVTSSSASMKFQIPFPVQMRVASSSIDLPANMSTNNLFAFYDGNSDFILTAISIDQASPWLMGFTGTSSGMTAYRPGAVQSENNNTSFIGISAEL